MRSLSYKHPHPVWYPDDCWKIMQLMETLGYSISERFAQMAWEEYSSSLCAGWLMVPDDAEYVFECIKPYVLVGEELNVTVQ